MATRVQMPQLGATMTEGRVVKWLVAEGQPIRKGEPVAEIETDKIVAEVEAPADGVLARIVAQPDEAVKVTGLLGWIAAPGEDLPPAEKELEAQHAAVGAILKPPAAERKLPSDAERVRASPRARRLARDLGVDLHQVRGSGPGGRITGEDVEAHAATMREEGSPPAPETPVQEVVPLTGARALIARRMAESARAVAAVTLFTEAEADRLSRLREELREALGSALGYDELLIKIAARALHDFPNLNVRLTEKGLQQLAEINIGFALDTEQGLLIPVIRDADRKGLLQIAREVRELVERGRAGRLSPDDLAGGTFTITNLGMHGVGWFTPIINLPQCAILGIGETACRPVVVDGELAVRETVWLSLTFNHRLVDGGPAARFMQRIARLVEEPRLLLI